MNLFTLHVPRAISLLPLPAAFLLVIHNFATPCLNYLLHSSSLTLLSFFLTKFPLVYLPAKHLLFLIAFEKMTFVLSFWLQCAPFACVQKIKRFLFLNFSIMNNTLLRKIRRHFAGMRKYLFLNSGIITINDCPSRLPCVTVRKCIKTSRFAFLLFSGSLSVRDCLCLPSLVFLKQHKNSLRGLTRVDFFACCGSIIILSAFLFSTNVDGSPIRRRVKRVLPNS